MSIELWQRVKTLEREVEILKKPQPGAFSLAQFNAQLDNLSKRLEDLENKYRMLNARIARKVEAL
jgi:hypothetical protein